MMTKLAGIGAIADAFDAFILDQYGVLHDGIAPYDGAIDALRHLASAGKPVVILSNSGKRSAPNRDRLERLGFPRSLYTHLLTSGEVTWQALHDRRDPFWRGLGHRCLHLTRDDDHGLLAGLDLEQVSSPERADFVLASGIDTPARSVDSYCPVLAVAAARRLPMVCANPDRVAVSGSSLIDSVGALGQLYQSLDGTVRYIGKPWPEVFAASLDLLKATPARTVIVGDNPATDITGGHGAGIATILVLSGVHGQSSLRSGDSGADYVLPSFQW